MTFLSPKTVKHIENLLANFEEKQDFVCQISCRGCDAIYIEETGRSVKTRKREHASAVKNFDPKKSTLCQNVLNCDHVIKWENGIILRSEPQVNKRRTAEIILINRKAEERNVLNCNGSAISGVYKLLFNS